MFEEVMAYNLHEFNGPNIYTFKKISSVIQNNKFLMNPNSCLIHNLLTINQILPYQTQTTTLTTS